MRSVFTIWLIGSLLYGHLAQAQSQTIPLNSDYYHLVDRLEIKQGKWAGTFHSSVKPYSRQSVVQLTDSVLSNPFVRLSPTDRFIVRYLRNDSWEWVPTAYRDSASLLASRAAELHTGQKRVGDSRHPFGPFYRKVSDAYSIQNDDFDIHISPAVNFGYGQEINTDSIGSRLRPFINTRGVEIRGSIRKRLSFYTYLSDNQALFSRYIWDYGQLYTTDPATGFAPGEGLTKRNGGGADPSPYNHSDFLSARGYISFNALKLINIQFGHDRNFIGNGYRSLFLSDNSAPYLFLRLTTRLGRFQYTNLLTALQNTQAPVSKTQTYPQKYAAMHHLSIDLNDHINLGIFEAVVFSRTQLELNYFNPIILYRFIESYRNSADNSLMGIDFKANFRQHFLVYSQFLLDEFYISALRARNGSRLNKFAFQAGLKYIDAFGIPNLDFQAELNLARPYTYAHRSGQTNYAHNNQPLAHPLGANFVEGLGIVRFQPLNRWTATGTFGVMRYGVDPPNRNFGGNVLANYDNWVVWPGQADGGHHIGQGRATLVTYGDFRVSFMAKHNFFIDFRQLFRNSDSQTTRLTFKTISTTFALRWNLPYRTLVL